MSIFVFFDNFQYIIYNKKYYSNKALALSGGQIIPNRLLFSTADTRYIPIRCNECQELTEE